MTHREAWDRLDEFLDGALGAEARWQVAAHLADCPVCRTQVATQALLRGVVRDRLTAVAPPPGLTTRLTAALTAETALSSPVIQQTRPGLPVRLVALVGTALAALWLVVAIAIPAARSEGDLTRELVAAHALFAHDESMLDIAGDAAAITTWFQDAAGLRVSAPRMDGYTLVGGRLIALDGRPVAQLVYEGVPEGIYLSLLEVQPDNRNPVQRALVDELVFNQEGPTSMATWSSGKQRVALIGTVPPDELRRLAHDLARPSSTGQQPRT